jgi:hypothetical protein
MTDLTRQPYDLRQGDFIQIRAFANNMNGWSDESAANTDEVRVDASLPQAINERPELERITG